MSTTYIKSDMYDNMLNDNAIKSIYDTIFKSGNDLEQIRIADYQATYQVCVFLV